MPRMGGEGTVLTTVQSEGGTEKKNGRFDQYSDGSTSVASIVSPHWMRRRINEIES